MQESIWSLLFQMKNLLFQWHLSMAGALLWGILIYFICLLLFFRKKSLIQNLCIVVLFLYIAAVLQSIQCLSIPNSFPLDMPSLMQTVGTVTWISYPSSELSGNNFLIALLRDFLILIPVGFFISSLSRQIRLGQMLLISLLCGAGLEILQLLANILSQNVSNSVSAGGTVLNAAGCLSGYLIFAAFQKLPIPKHKARHYAHSGQVL